MRSADLITLVRTFLVFPIVYLIFVKFNPVAILLLMLIMFVLDALDGFAAVGEASSGKVTFFDYLSAVSGNPAKKKLVSRYKNSISIKYSYSGRLDIAGDRVIEYVLWITFVYLTLIPIWVLFIVVLRHSFVDAMFAVKGTSSRLKNRFASALYTSALGRFFGAALKGMAFGYLVLVYVWGWPLTVGYVLVATAVIYILIRGIADIYEALSDVV